MKKTIRKFALQNAIKFEGKANPGSIIGKVFGENPEFKKKAKEVQDEIKKAIEEINSMSLEDQKNELEKIAPELLEEKKKEKRVGLKSLNNIGENIVMRFEPSPSGPMHIGHSYALMLNYEYCKQYRGKLILRIADTNPDNIYPAAYELLEDNFKWLCPDIEYEFHIQSDRMELYYENAMRLISEHHAYVCSCEQEEFRKLINAKQECPCRKNDVEENTKRWKAMLNDAKEGSYVVRLKTDVNHKNPAMRDFPLLRINLTEHARQQKKYRVWPLLNFAVAVDDHTMGLTHVLRGKDHYDNTKRQMYIFDYMKWTVPEYIHTGRINFEGLRLKTTDTRKAIENGEFEGWDDIRLPFLHALRRRGYQPGAFHKYAVAVGTTMTDKKVDAKEFFKAINSFNKEIIDPIASRLFFVYDAVEVEIENAPLLEVELDIHPDFKKGGRKFKTSSKFLLTKKDMEIIDKMKDGEVIRLMDCLNFTKQKGKFVFHSKSYEDYKKEGKLIIHWLPKKEVNIEVLMPDKTIISGFGEEAVKKLKIGEVCQFERFGFCKFDEKLDDVYRFWFTHK